MTEQADKNLEVAARALGLEPEIPVAEEPAAEEVAAVEAPPAEESSAGGSG